MRLTKKKAIELHRELWDWLYHHPSKGKDDWPGWERNGGAIKDEINADCFLCELAEGRCSRCIGDWGAGKEGKCITSYFGSWEDAKSPKTRKKYAKLVRDVV